ncbi:beta-lactamase family protein [Nonomuraea sp. 3-1Str]|uniref:serine hydrolase domain-containing protein n=1 Tax=Nonomuraea sp. 3-1Str TaxID=2929801 RepID=UPI00285B9EFA|nr:serine hydrolase domain-containing protein [Nonomuraea sp. 3-1Str]MDR8412458.1 beta-lactamase family protein [Nonomuraea sp. 3-1Str]
MSRARTVGMTAMASAMLALSVQAPATADGKVTLGDVQQAIENVAKTAGVVGVIGEVYVDGKRVAQGTAGSRLLDGKGGRIPPGSRYRIASQTKLMEATVILQLVGEGKLKLDDKLSAVLPEMAEHDYVDRADEITVQQLIRHTSGIPDFMESGKFDVFDFTTAYQLIDLVKAARTVLRKGEPGQYLYSTTNYVLLGMIIEKLTGHDRAGEFKRRLFTPLGMKHTYLATKVSDQIKGPHGHGYYPDAKGRPRDVDRLNATIGAEGAISTAHDVSAYYRALNQGKLLPADLQRQLPRPFPELCGGTVSAASGGMPGISSTTFSSTDGRIQFAVAATLKIDNEQAMAVGDAVTQAAKAVLCPGQ